ncbi:MAG: AMP-dependent synthetase and ligase [Acidimicrobiia bacterium]|nr:AMP-dependent synthetase and ligase [Acidimicrobiia bacterium]
MTQLSYGRNLTERAQRHPDRVAMVHVSESGVEREVTWLELDRRSNQVARLFEQRGVQQGSLVAIALPNLVEHYFSAYGAWKMGATVLPMRWSLPTWEQERLVALAEPAVIVSDGPLDDPRVVSLDDIRASVSLDDSALPDRTAAPARAIATSGSTGKPKLIVTPSPAVFDSEAPMNVGAPASEEIIQLVTSPLYHTNGFGSHLRLMAGGFIIVMERFDAARVLDLIEKYHVNHVIMVPTMLQRVVRVPDVEKRDLSSLTRVYYGGASLAPWVAQKWIELVGPEHFFLQYGGTEELGGTICRGDEWLLHPGTVGRPVNSELRILDDAGKEVPPGEIGDIFMRPTAGPPPFRYVGAPMPKFTEDGFTTYGDLGWVDGEGYLYIADRRVDMVVTGGAVESHVALADLQIVGGGARAGEGQGAGADFVHHEMVGQRVIPTGKGAGESRVGIIKAQIEGARHGEARGGHVDDRAGAGD